MKFSVLLLVLFACLFAAVSADPSTLDFITAINSTYPPEVIINQITPCILRDSCETCALDWGCVWVSKGSFEALDNGVPFLEYPKVSYCYSGNPFGGSRQTLENIESYGGPSTIRATFGFFNFSWKQCNLMGGVVVVMAGSGIALVLLLLLILICCCCCCTRKKAEYYDNL